MLVGLIEGNEGKAMDPCPTIMYTVVYIGSLPPKKAFQGLVRSYHAWMLRPPIIGSSHECFWALRCGT